MVRPVVVMSVTAPVGRAVEAVHDRFTSPLHSPRVASILGITLGVTFTLCFATGLVTWWIQHPPAWFAWPARPAGLYRITQGLHVASGIASIPLLLAKLWAVYPHFWSWPAVRNVAHAVERISLLPLVGGSLFLLFSGTANIALWYPWNFSFPVAHHWAAWITMGGLIAHIGAKVHVAREALGHEEPAIEPNGPPPGLGRRQFLGATFGASALLTVVTVGQTVRPLSPLALLAPRRPEIGPQGLPVNKTAAGARVLDLVDPATFRLVVTDGATRHDLTLADLRGMTQRSARLPIACVEGWSATAEWRGVAVATLFRNLDIEVAGIDIVGVESLQPKGSFRRSDLTRSLLLDRDTLLALEVNGEELHPDHGFPLRLIAPNRPGVLQTKWVGELVVRRSP